ncbi:Hg(II)-responsive transcriptional regulator [Peribacillus asahii]|uniref:Hg(II)-responsive transcriptional regulator n=1 Tax=Peribacillus asahii TaxID=228899 RepID=UPI0020795C0F|nr:Hg(II)-responsive transcriptional regulator [Peribacillus asahii]USK62419.1 Hg(II)-responsive transcriptional regulator [Peribacillus asahii]
MMYLIGKLAEKCGVNKETIRYYERMGIVLEPSRTDSGYKMYPSETVERIRFIKRMQELGFSLSEIHKLLGIVDKDDERCIHMYDFIIQKINEVQKKIRDLKRIENMLINLKECCPDEKSLYECPIIETLMNEKKGGE